MENTEMLPFMAETGKNWAEGNVIVIVLIQRQRDLRRDRKIRG